MFDPLLIHSGQGDFKIMHSSNFTLVFAGTFNTKPINKTKYVQELS